MRLKSSQTERAAGRTTAGTSPAGLLRSRLRLKCGQEAEGNNKAPAANATGAGGESQATFGGSFIRTVFTKLTISTTQR